MAVPEQVQSGLLLLVYIRLKHDMVLRCLQKAPGAVNSNQMVGNRLSLRLGRVIEMLLRGPACFDFDSYIKASPDLESRSPEQLWLQFVLEDQFSGRKFW